MPIDLESPASLASMVRVTGDIDVAITFGPGAEVRAAEVLSSNGLLPAADGRSTFVGPGMSVDLLVCLDSWGRETRFRITRERSARPLSRQHVVTYAIGDSQIHVSDRGMLVLHKAIAWADRHADKDVVDIAGLALADLVEGGSGADQLSELVASLHDEYGRMLENVARVFDNLDGAGPRAFAREVRSLLRPQGIRMSDDEEEAICKIASAAVCQMLEDWR
jgi:hypothetical protein